MPRRILCEQRRQREMQGNDRVSHRLGEAETRAVASRFWEGEAAGGQDEAFRAQPRAVLAVDQETAPRKFVRAHGDHTERGTDAAPALMAGAEQCIDDVLGAVADGEHLAAVLHFEGSLDAPRKSRRDLGLGGKLAAPSPKLPLCLSFRDSGACRCMKTSQDLVRSENIRFLRLPEVTRRVGLVRSTVYQKIEQGEFPAPFKLGTRISFWLESDIQEWQTRVVASGRRPTPTASARESGYSAQASVRGTQ